MGVRLASLNAVKTLLRIPTTETGLDGVLAPLLETMSSDCETYCGRVFASQSVVKEQYDGGGEALCLRNFPVDADATFELFTTGFYTTIESGFYTSVQLQDTQFFVDYLRGILSLQAGLQFPTERNSIFVTYTGGYSVTGDLSYPDGLTVVNVPLQLQRAVAGMTVAEWRFQQGTIEFDEYQKLKDYFETQYGPFVRTA